MAALTTWIGHEEIKILTKTTSMEENSVETHHNNS